MAFAPPAHDTSAPERSTAASRDRETPLTVVNDPPRYSVVPSVTIASTEPLVAGAHGSNAPVVRSTAARWRRD